MMGFFMPSLIFKILIYQFSFLCSWYLLADNDEFNALQQKAVGGSAKAQYVLANNFYDGKGVAQNYNKSFYWYEKAAQQNFLPAQSDLGYMYLYGKGVSKDERLAFYWFEKAAKHGITEAQLNLGYLYDHGRGVTQNDQKAYFWYHQAALGNNAKAQYNLGLMYQYGQGIQQDIPQSIKWFQSASKLDYIKAKQKLEQFKKITLCENSSTKLFGIALKCASRHLMSSAILNAGAKPIRENTDYFNDLYETKNVFKGSKNLEVFYIEGVFAKAKYSFPSMMEPYQVRTIKDLVALKYGQPDEVKGQIDRGDVLYSWKLNDGIILNVKRSWPDTTSYIEYINPVNHKLLLSSLEK
ncbi:hypothetical protein CF386_08345 [Paraphotobacterium marinum]|uniref:Sel1 repeat family protein n=2 Tax=Paraphotobacterium marinum TaxID=1755811 RepID=A0A220VFF3_9GAMM|nr:hypothetical protein CF386_08345 [Paraphotobacterium marinum]